MGDSNYTPEPWVGFSDQGKLVAIMPAMREGNICTFAQSPTDADGRIMIAAPDLLAAASRIVNRATAFMRENPAWDDDDFVPVHMGELRTLIDAIEAMGF